MTTTIRCERLTKMYGRNRGIVDLDLEVRAGEIFGFLGPNGAGKTTTIRLLLDLVRPTSGRVEVLGLDPRVDGLELRRRIGYVPGELALYEAMTGAQTLEFLGELRGTHDPRRVEALAARLDLDLSRPIRSLSKGNKQKVGLLQALAHEPKLLILDEPTSGLDPLVQHTVHDLLADLKREGTTIFLSSHALNEVEETADRVGIIRAGTLVAIEAIGALKERARRYVEVLFADPIASNAFDGVPGVRDVTVDGPRARLTVDGSMDALVKALARFDVTRMTTHEADLEDVFLAYYSERGPGADGDLP